jgi:hypothetical protein
MTPLLLADLANTPLQWWQVATGILSIPAAVIALAYSYYQIPKARAEIEKTHAETAKLKKDLSTQKDELNEQKQKLDDVTVFLFNNFINEAELRHLEGLASPDPYPLERTGFARLELRHLRASRLITVSSGIGELPKHIRDLHEHAALTKAARYYLERRKTLKFDNVA